MHVYHIKKPSTNFEDFSSTGDPLPKDDASQHGPMSEYDKLVQSFYARLLEQRRAHMEEEEKNEYQGTKGSTKYPGWDDMTIANLHSLFLLFDKNLNGMLNYDDFSAVLESLGDETSNDYRKQMFDDIDRDMDGWITYDEFLEVIYHFHPQEGDTLTGLAKLCFDIAENIKFVSALSVGEQLEYGLF
ncbi:alpha-actinin A-like isoform X2 [Atheta coriaria]|uniref:alpha-actinin A-like isoform X2 n=1 Tax=Dalotia coriaria TaxID=877792 RepID=UPI0031F465C5